MSVRGIPFRIAALSLIVVGCLPSTGNMPEAEQEVETGGFSVIPLYDERRITKKPFGIFITPQDSPVSPEKFNGYHTGADFEVLGDEPSDLWVTALCSGTVRYAQWVKGYGGVLVQDCTGTDAPVTILYGHVSMDSLVHEVGDAIDEGEEIGHLGVGFSDETDGERPHLHLSVHKGTRVDLRGYVQNEEELGNWIDPVLLLGGS